MSARWSHRLVGLDLVQISEIAQIPNAYAQRPPTQAATLKGHWRPSSTKPEHETRWKRCEQNISERQAIIYGQGEHGRMNRIVPADKQRTSSIPYDCLTRRQAGSDSSQQRGASRQAAAHEAEEKLDFGFVGSESIRRELW